MQKENGNSSLGNHKASLSLKVALALLIAGLFSLECRAGWTRDASSDDVSGTISNTNSLSINSSTNGNSTDLSITSTNDGTAEWGSWISESYATATGSASDSGVSVSVSQDSHSQVIAFDTLLGFTAGANIVVSVSATYEWDGPPSGPQGTAAEPVSVHLSIDCMADSVQWVTCASVGSDVSSDQGGATGGTTATIGILSGGGLDDINFSPVANANGLATSAPTATGLALVDPGQTGGTGPDSYTPYTYYDVEPANGAEYTEASYSIQLEEDAELNQGSVSFEAMVAVNSESGAHVAKDDEDHAAPTGAVGGSGFNGSASVGISGIIIH